VFFNRQSAYLCVQTMLLFSSTYSFIRTRQTSYRDFSRKTSDFVDRTYPIELEINDTIDTDRSASYLELHLEIDSEGRLRTKHYDKRDAFNFLIVNFPFISSNIPAASAYGAYRIKIEYVLSSVLWCPLRIQHKNDARFIFTSSLFVGGLVSFLTLFVFVHV
jgi:hypothetical protein